jgi:hypothetical protein
LSVAAGIAGSILVARESFALGAALLALSVLALRWPWSIWTAEPADDLRPRARRLGLLAVCAVAVFFRVYRLNPPGLWGDDAINGLLAFDILDGRIRSPLQIISHAHSNFHALSNYLIAAAFWAFGPGLTPLRLPSIVCSVLCVPLLYATAAPLFGARVGLLAALFFATSPPQLAHSKQLIQLVLGELLQLAGLCLLVRGVVSGRRWQVAAAGLPLALCCYTYHAARLAPLVAVVYGVALLRASASRVRSEESGVRSRTRSTAGQLLTPHSSPLTRGAATRNLTWALVVFALALSPAIIGYIRDPSALFGRVEATSLWPVIRERGSLAPLWDSVWRTLLMFHYQQGPEYHWFGLGFDPAFNAVVGFLLVHGLVQGLLHWREPRHLLLLAWVGIGLVPGLLSAGAPRLYRALLATPPLYVWAALPLGQLWTASGRAAAYRLRRGLTLALVTAVVLIDFNYYFYRVYTHPVFNWFQGARIVEMARTLRGYGPGWTGYLLADNYSAHHETFTFLSRCWGLTLRDVASLTEVLPLGELPENGALFIMSEANLGAAPAIAERYPGGTLSRRSEPVLRSWWLHDRLPLAPWDEPPRLTAGFYPVPRAVAERPTDRPRGLLANYQGAVAVRRAEPYPFYYFFPPTFPQPFTAHWSGRITVPEPGGYEITVEANGRALVWIDGRRLRSGARVASGTHDFAVEIRDVPARARLQISWEGRSRPRELVPPAAWSPP